MSAAINEEGDTSIKFVLGTLADHRVLLDFRRKVDHLKLSPEMALELAEGLVEAAREAARGRIILTATDIHRG